MALRRFLPCQCPVRPELSRDSHELMGPSADVALLVMQASTSLKIARRNSSIIEVGAVRASQGVIVHRDHVMEACSGNRPDRAWLSALVHW